ncbi:hypothetical protein HK100_007816 [Physocladia obscura]|uniref:DNA-directed RNA polymerase n=1 Tax=Physocladia obscura TaxID=109957 RepID=A0AAD5SNY7_9FUNG|nr:hypothetical protein HK100_007816 [Physocladia obscura]
MEIYGYHQPGLDDIAEYVKPFLNQVPYFGEDEPPRPRLAAATSVQAIGLPRQELVSTNSPLHSNQPPLRTPLLDVICKEIRHNKRSSIPGGAFLVAFINMQANYEDSIIFSKKVNEYKAFATRGFIIHPKPDNTPDIRVGSKLTYRTTWWRPRVVGTVIAKGTNKNRRAYVIAEVLSDDLEVGNKIATQHGQKFTVSEINDYENLSLCEDTDNGTEFYAHAYFPASTINSRNTPGQIYEATSTFNLINQYEFDPTKIDSSRVLSDYEMNNPPTKLKTCYFKYLGTNEYMFTAQSKQVIGKLASLDKLKKNASFTEVLPGIKAKLHDFLKEEVIKVKSELVTCLSNKCKTDVIINKAKSDFNFYLEKINWTQLTQMTQADIAVDVNHALNLLDKALVDISLQSMIAKDVESVKSQKKATAFSEKKKEKSLLKPLKKVKKVQQTKKQTGEEKKNSVKTNGGKK